MIWRALNATTAKHFSEVKTTGIITCREICLWRFLCCMCCMLHCRAQCQDYDPRSILYLSTFMDHGILWLHHVRVAWKLPNISCVCGWLLSLQRSIINSWTTIWIISYDKISTIDTTTIIICLIIIIIIIGVVRRVLGYTKVVWTSSRFV